MVARYSPGAIFLPRFWLLLRQPHFPAAPAARLVHFFLYALLLLTPSRPHGFYLPRPGA